MKNYRPVLPPIQNEIYIDNLSVGDLFKFESKCYRRIDYICTKDNHIFNAEDVNSKQLIYIEHFEPVELFSLDKFFDEVT